LATKLSIAITRETAIASLIETCGNIASLLGVEPPDLSMEFRDLDLQQAEQLKSLAAFNQNVIEALTVPAGSKAKAGAKTK